MQRRGILSVLGLSLTGGCLRLTGETTEVNTEPTDSEATDSRMSPTEETTDRRPTTSDTTESATESETETETPTSEPPGVTTAWITERPVAVNERPVVDGETVYAVTKSDPSANRRQLTAFATDSGDEQWTATDVGQAPTAIADGRLYVPQGRGAVAVDGTGRVQWRVSTDTRYYATGISAAGNRAYLTVRWDQTDTTDETYPPKTTVHCLNAMTGDEVWRTEVSDWVVGSPLVADRLYLPVTLRREQSGSPKGRLVALDKDAGTVAWDLALSGRSRGSLRSLGDGVVGLAITIPASGSTAASTEFVAISLTDRTVIWSKQLGGVSVGVDDGTVYVPTYDGLAAYDGTSGAEQWAIETETLLRDLTANSGLIVAKTSDGELIAVGADGTRRWTFEARGEKSPPAIGDSRVYVGTNTGKFYAIDGVEG